MPASPPACSGSDCRGLEGGEGARSFVSVRAGVRLSGRFLALPLLLLQLRQGRAVVAQRGETAGLEGAAVEAWPVVVVALADDLAAADDDAAMSVVEGGFAGLLEAEGEVGVGSWRHCCFDYGCLIGD